MVYDMYPMDVLAGSKAKCGVRVVRSFVAQQASSGTLCHSAQSQYCCGCRQGTVSGPISVHGTNFTEGEGPKHEKQHTHLGHITSGLLEATKTLWAPVCETQTSASAAVGHDPKHMADLSGGCKAVRTLKE